MVLIVSQANAVPDADFRLATSEPPPAPFPRLNRSRDPQIFHRLSSPSASQPQHLGILLDLVAPRARLGPVIRRALLPLRPEALVEVPLQVAAHARRLVEKSASVALLEGVDDVYAGYSGLVSDRRCGGNGRGVRRFSALSRWECMVGGWFRRSLRGPVWCRVQNLLRRVRLRFARDQFGGMG